MGQSTKDKSGNTKESIGSWLSSPQWKHELEAALKKDTPVSNGLAEARKIEPKKLKKPIGF